MSKYKINQQDVLDLYGQGLSKSETARRYCKKHNIFYDDKIRRKISHIIKNLGLNNTSYTQTSEYKQKVSVSQEKEPQKQFFDARDINGKLMDIETYCSHYGLDYSKVRSYKLISHTGVPFFNVVFREDDEEIYDIENVKNRIDEFLTSNNLKGDARPQVNEHGKVGVLKIADLHIGAVVEGLLKTPDYNPQIVCDKLISIANKINRFVYNTVHVHILGDILEAFDAKMHPASWKSLDKNYVGAEGVKIAVKILHECLLSRIKGLGEIKIVAGNHDRITSDKNDDSEGQSANLVAWGLSLIGYNVEFDPYVLTHKVKGINHILTHGHLPLSTKSGEALSWIYGDKDYYNLITMGHLHTNIEKLSAKRLDGFSVVEDDSINYKKMYIPSVFSGNAYSERLALYSQSGFLLVEDNGEGKPNIFNFSL